MFASTASFVSSEVQNLLDSPWFLMANWKWLALVAATFAVLFINKFSRIFIYKLKNRFYPQPEINRLGIEKTFIGYFIDQNIEKALSWVLASLIGMVIVENLELVPNLEKYLLIVLKVTLCGHLLRLAYFAADASGLLIHNWAHKSDSQINDQLAPLATKTLKVLVIIIGSLVIMQNFGVNVTALLAGLGLGGVALAFAAQDTVANVFGTITILLDSPFKIGDRIKIIDVEGDVEEVGFRSTRIRTIANSVVTLPNSTVAKEKIDNITQRNGVCRFRHVFGFTYTASPELLEKFCENVRYYLKQDHRVQQERVIVQFTELAESSINILINFHFNVQETESETMILQKYLMDLFKISKEQKLDFAFPTRTIVMAQN